MGHLFSKKKIASKITEQDKAVLQLKQQRDKIKQYQRRIETKLESERQLAKKLLNEGKKDRAKLLLRKKKFQEQLLERTDNQLENLERMTHDIEFAQIEIKVVDGLKIGNEALKKLNEALNIEDIERILDETREGVEKQEEIDLLLSGVLTEEDEDAVLEELNDMIIELEPDNTTKDNDVELSLPEVPDTELEDATKERKKKATPIAVEG